MTDEVTERSAEDGGFIDPEMTTKELVEFLALPNISDPLGLRKWLRATIETLQIASGEATKNYRRGQADGAIIALRAAAARIIGD